MARLFAALVFTLPLVLSQSAFAQLRTARVSTASYMRMNRSRYNAGYTRTGPRQEIRFLHRNGTRIIGRGR
jgi:hypothetical protein